MNNVVIAGDVNDQGAVPDQELIDWLAIGYSHERAAAEVGISAKTVQRRMKTLGFEERVIRRRRQLQMERFGPVLGLFGKAGRRLDALLDSEDERVAIAAVRAVYDIGSRIRLEQEYQGLSERLDSVTSEVEEMTHKYSSARTELDRSDVELLKREVKLDEREARLEKRENILARRSVEDEG